MHSFITVIPKPGKDPSLPYNYRPIADYKILANCLSQLLSKLIDKDQVGFVPARHAGDNTRRTIDLVDMLGRVCRPTLVLSLQGVQNY